MKVFFYSLLVIAQILSAPAFAAPAVMKDGVDVRAPILMKELTATPATPGAGFKGIYPKNDGKLYTLNSSGAEVQVGAGSGTTTNLLTNGSFDDLTATNGWTVSAGSASADTSDYVDGTQSLAISLSAVSGTIVTQTVTPGQTLVGNNLEHSIYVKTSLTNIQMCAMQGTTEVQCQSAPSTNQWARLSFTIAAPSSGAIGVRVKSTSSATGTVKVDGGYTGVARNLTTVLTEYSWQSWTPTGSWTTNATYTGKKRRVGDNIEYEVHISLSGAPGGTSALTINLPTGDAVDTTKVSVSNIRKIYPSAVQIYQNSTSKVMSGVVIGGNSTTMQIQFTDTGAASTASTAQITATSPITFGASDSVNINFSLPIAGLTAENGFRPDQVGGVWSGYFDSTCIWARTNTAAGDFTADATCNLVQTQNANFGTVSAVSGVLPGVQFTPAKAGLYQVCMGAKVYGSATDSYTSLRMLDGSSNILSTAVVRQPSGSANLMHSVTLCGVLNASSVTTTTAKLVGSASSGTINLDGSSGGGIYPVEISIASLNQTSTAPILTGSITSNSTGLERSERAIITYSAGVPSVNSQSGSWVTSVSDNATGDTTLSIASGMFSGTPSCVAQAIAASAGVGVGTARVAKIVSPVSSTSVRVVIQDDTGSAVDPDSIHIHCMGPR
jgi:hypothetical protein